MTTILFTGDSITDGNRYKRPDQAWDLNHQMGHSFAYIINGLLGSKYPEKDLHFINRGISGNKISDLYSRVEGDLNELKPDIVSILVGINDGPSEGRGFRPTAKAHYDAIYRMMLDTVRAVLPEVRFIFCEPFVCRCGKIGERYDEWRNCMEGYSQAVRRIAKDYNGIFVPLQEAFDEACEKKEVSYWCWDGIHPTENGHGLIARQWLKYVEETL